MAAPDGGYGPSAGGLGHPLSVVPDAFLPSSLTPIPRHYRHHPSVIPDPDRGSTDGARGMGQGALGRLMSGTIGGLNLVHSRICRNPPRLSAAATSGGTVKLNSQVDRFVRPLRRYRSIRVPGIPHGTSTCSPRVSYASASRVNVRSKACRRSDSQRLSYESSRVHLERDRLVLAAHIDVFLVPID